MLPVISFGARPVVTADARTRISPRSRRSSRRFSTTAAESSTCCTAGLRAEQGARTAATELGIQNKFFWTTPLTVMPPSSLDPPAPPKPDAAAMKAALEEKLATFKVSKIDLVMVSASAPTRRTSPS